ncbi:hypothetical protein IE53DRAFT_310250 [Violaceomyces palustris]|uniref:Uncharacterized protein n=1 Tax=Violaceomyces palustris TaxID=1673888 RepID=A0ACD0P5Y9_9BASI|nr:hypothetical protein IE53DRAFT_310250 [Violaceomyces palustris]
MRSLFKFQPSHRPPPEPRKGKLPVFTAGQQLRLFSAGILPTLIPIWATQHFLGYVWPLWAKAVWFGLVSQSINDYYADFLNEMGYKWGYLDGDKPRDKIPDEYVDTIFVLGLVTPFVRLGLVAWITYRPDHSLSLSISDLPLFYLKLFLVSLFLDLFFYSYHRAFHEVDFLWKYHKTHHLTKHPSPLLASLSDVEQDFIEALVCPYLGLLIAHMILPMTFEEGAMILSFISVAEIMGHTGIRAYIEAGNTALLLRPFGLELTVEDHDIHHREGWKKSNNYGKQSRFWDFVFGTMGTRIECKPEMIDWKLSIFDDVPPEPIQEARSVEQEKKKL